VKLPSCRGFREHLRGQEDGAEHLQRNHRVGARGTESDQTSASGWLCITAAIAPAFQRQDLIIRRDATASFLLSEEDVAGVTVSLSEATCKAKALSCITQSHPPALPKSLWVDFEGVLGNMHRSV